MAPVVELAPVPFPFPVLPFPVPPFPVLPFPRRLKSPPSPPKRPVAALELVRVIVAVWPTFTLAMSALSTARSTVYRPVLTTWTCALEELLDESLELAGFGLVPDPIDASDCPDPLPVPVASVPPVPLLESCSPTVRFTAATVPSKVETSDAFASASVASMSESFADVRLDSSAASCSDDAPDAWSSESLALASATDDCAAVTSDWSAAESIVASTWPACTVSPAFTFTAVTVPAEEKLRSSVWAAATVPSADTVTAIGPRVTVASCLVLVAEAEASSLGRNANHQTPTMAATIRIGTSTIGWTRLRRRIGPRSPGRPRGT